jgi:hypothetical protein
MSTLVIIFAVAFLLSAALLLLAIFQRQRLAALLFKAPYIGPRIQQRAIKEISADPEKMIEHLPSELGNKQQQAVAQVLKGRSPEEIEQLMNKALSGQALSPADLQRPVGSSGKINKKKVADRRKKNRQARQQRKKNRK